MNTLMRHVAFAVLLPAVLAGCMDRDREMINRKSDGVDTFKFQPPPRPTQSPKPVDVTRNQEKSPTDSNSSDGTETFKFNKDAKYLPRNNSKSGG